MTKKKMQLLTGDKYSGVDVDYDPNRRLVTLSGWYDSYTGIAPETMTLTKFLFHLGITHHDCTKALESILWRKCANCEEMQWTYFDGEAGICVDDVACKARCIERDRTICTRCEGTGRDPAEWETEACGDCGGAGYRSAAEIAAFAAVETR